MESFKLPKFAGNNNEWELFKTKFEAYLGFNNLKTADSHGVETIQDGKAYYALLMCVEGQPLSIVKQAKVGKSQEAWDLLKQFYEPTTNLRKFSLHRELSIAKMKGREDVASFILRIEGLQRSLGDMGEQISGQTMLQILLNGLSSEFDQLMTSMALLNADLDYESAKKTLLSHQERINERKATNGILTDSEGALVAFRGKCYICHKIGHRASQCKQPCSVCGKLGHSANRCWKNEQSKDNGKAKEKKEIALVTEEVNTKKFIVDSGASSHLCGQRNWFDNLEDIEELSIAGVGGNLKAVGRGNIKMRTNGIPINIEGVLYVPGLQYNLLSVGRIVEKGYEVKFGKEAAIVAEAEIKLTSEGNMQILCEDEETARVSIDHLRMGHSGYINAEGFCKPCCIGKSSRLPLHTADPRPVNKEGLVHTDIFGPVEEDSVGGNKFAIIFVDDATRYKEIYFIRHKNEALGALRKYCAVHKIKTLHGDNDTVFRSRDFTRFCEDRGINQTFSSPYTPQQNGVSERSWRTLQESALAMMAHANMKKAFWAFAMDTANFISNRSYHRTIGKTPYEALYGVKPNLKRMRVFGCPAFYLNENKRKFDPKALEGIFVGYTATAYKIWTGRRVVVSRNVTFNERWREVELPMENDIDEEEEEDDEVMEPEPGQESEIELEMEPGEEEFVDEAEYNNDGEGDNDDDAGDNDDDAEDNGDEEDNDNDDEVNRNEEQTLRRSTRIRKSPQPYWKIRNETAMVTTVEEALKDENWRAAINDELKSLDKMNTFTFCEKPEGRDLIKGKWVLRIKYKEDGSIDKYKARYVAKGYSQIPGIDFSETYSPVARVETIRTLLKIAAEKGLEVQQMDVKTAYLNSRLEEEIYMEIPEAYQQYGRIPKNANCVKLNKALYGLKQGAREWFNCLTNAVGEIGMNQIEADDAVFVKEVNGKRIILAAYVDDLIIVSESPELTKELKDKLNSKFEMKDMGQAKYILGIQIEHEEGGIGIHQKKYIEEILKRFKMENCSGSDTPSGSYLEPVNEQDKDIDAPYASAIGALLYLANTTRPDISNAVREAAQYVKDYKERHWKAVKRIMRYLQKTKESRIFYKRNGGLELIGYADADFANCKESGKSVTGKMFFLGGDIVSWSSRKQKTVSLSTTEAEVVALAQAIPDAIWLRMLLEGIGVKQENETRMFNDNQPALQILNDQNYGRLKHLKIKRHFIKDQLKRKEVSLHFLGTNDMVADICTKSLPRDRFNELVKHFLEREC